MRGRRGKRRNENKEGEGKSGKGNQPAASSDLFTLSSAFLARCSASVHNRRKASASASEMPAASWAASARSEASLAFASASVCSCFNLSVWQGNEEKLRRGLLLEEKDSRC
jgi:hypothetical protein